MKLNFYKNIKRAVICTLFLSFSLYGQSNTKTTETSATVADNTHSIIPYPKDVTYSNSSLELSGKITILADKELDKSSNIIAKELESIGFSIETLSSALNSNIKYIRDEKLTEEEYKIEISDKGITLFFSHEKGAFYGSQTLKQYLWSATVEDEKLLLPTILIHDKPENEYRGFHIDVSRHFFPKEFVFKIIDQMALYKLNKLQMHLTDDQGWRIVSDKYPLLTEVGGFREFNEHDKWAIEKAKTNPDYNFNPAYVKGGKYGGFYTKEDLKDIISYAGKNYIEVIPEIDMPGHMSAAIRAYSWISCDGELDWGAEFSKPMCVPKKEVMTFAKEIWDEVSLLFPSNRVHIGADEVDKSFWENEVVCQEFMKTNGWTHVNEIQNYFVTEITTHLEAKGKLVTAWDDIMVSNEDLIKNDVPASIDIMFWRDYKPEGANYAAENDNNIILTPWTWFYLSSRNSDDNFIAMYNFNEQEKLDPSVIEKKIGYQACVWTEHIPSEAVFENFVFPRFQGFSEVAWTSKRDFNSFKERLKLHLNYMDREDINYKKPGFMEAVNTP